MMPSARSIKLLRSQGYTVGIVERWIPYAQIRSDLFGFADLCAIHPEKNGITFVQTTTSANQSARIQKIKECVAAKTILQAGNSILVHGWRKGGKRGARKLWSCTVTEIYLYGDGLLAAKVLSDTDIMDLDHLPC